MPTMAVGITPAMKMASRSAKSKSDTVHVMLKQATIVVLALACGTARAALPDDALVDSGSQKLEHGDAKGALDDFKHAAEKAPRDPRPHYLRGAALMKLNDAAGAEEAFRKALALDPK